MPSTFSKSAILLCSALALGWNAGCNEQEGATLDNPRTAAPKEAVDQGDIDLPEYYGLYAIDSGETIEIKEGGQPAEFSANVEFLLFHKMAAMASGNVKLYRLNLQPEAPKPKEDGQFKGWDDWYQKSQIDFPRQMNAARSGVPTGSIRVDLREKPVANQPEMLRLVPSMLLEPGLYQLDGGGRFWIKRKSFGEAAVQHAEEAMENGRLDEAWSAAALAVVVHHDDVPVQNRMRLLQFGARVQLAEKAMSRGDWTNAEQQFWLAESAAFTDDMKDNARLLRTVDLPYRQAYESAKIAVEARRWNDALAAIRKASDVRPGSPELGQLYAAIPRIPLYGHAGGKGVWMVRFMADGTLLTAADDKTILLWDCDQRTPKSKINNDSNWLIAPHPSLRWIAIAGSDRRLMGFVEIGDLGSESRDRLVTLGPTSGVTALNASADGRFLLVGSNSWVVGFKNDYMTKERAAMYADAISKQESGSSEAADNLRRGQSLSATEVWDTETKSLWRVLPRTVDIKKTGVDWAVMAPNCKYVVTVGRAKGDRNRLTTCQVTVWDVEASRPIHSFDVSNYALYSVEIDPKSQFVVTTDKGNAIFWDIMTGTMMKRMSTDLSQLYALEFSDNGEIVALAGAGGFRVFDAHTNEELLRFEEQGDIKTIDISPDGRWIATGSNDSKGALALWRMPAEIAARCISGSGNGTNMQATTDSARLLREAVQAGDVSRAKALLEQGVSMHVRDESGSTAMHFAVMMRKHEVAALFLEYGGNVNVEEDPRAQGMTPWFYATSGDDLEMIRLLLKHGADPNAKLNGDRHPLDMVKSQETAELLIESGANVNAVSTGGRTALHMATFKSPGYVRLLLDKGANVNAKDKRGRTALHTVAEYGWDVAPNAQLAAGTEIAEILIQAGADVNLRDGAGVTPLGAAKKMHGTTRTKPGGPGQPMVDETVDRSKMIEYLISKGGKE